MAIDFREVDSNTMGILFNSDTPIVYIKNDGKIGVNTYAPTVDFEVTGDSKFTGNLTVTGDLNIDDITMDDLTVGTITTADNLGTANTGVTAVEYGNGRWHQTVLSFTDLAVGTAPDGTALGFGVLLYTLPAGVQNFQLAYSSVALSGPAAIQADTPEIGLGTVIASGVVSVLGGTATFEDIIEGSAATDVNGTVNVDHDNTVDLIRLSAAAKTVHLNVADTWASGGGAVTATGSIVLQWTTIS